MKNWRVKIGFFALAIGVVGCSPMMYNTGGYAYDDVYGVADPVAIAQRRAARADARRTEAAYSETDEMAYDAYVPGKYERLLYVFEEPIYLVPASYYNYRWGLSVGPWGWSIGYHYGWPYYDWGSPYWGGFYSWNWHWGWPYHYYHHYAHHYEYHPRRVTPPRGRTASDNFSRGRTVATYGGGRATTRPTPVSGGSTYTGRSVSNVSQSRTTTTTQPSRPTRTSSYSSGSSSSSSTSRSSSSSSSSSGSRSSGSSRGSFSR